MRFALVAPVSLAFIGLAACQNGSAMPPPSAPAMSSAPGAAAQMPQTTNSLPPGSTVSAPVTSGTGNVSRTHTY